MILLNFFDSHIERPEHPAGMIIIIIGVVVLIVVSLGRLGLGYGISFIIILFIIIIVDNITYYSLSTDKFFA
jgi:hypothetical protein